MEGIILLTRATALITDPVLIMGGIPAASASQFTIDRTMSAALVTGLAALITFGSLAIGHGGTVRKFGFTAITLFEDTKTLPLVQRRHTTGLPSRAQSTQQTEKSADEHFRKIMAL